MLYWWQEIFSTMNTRRSKIRIRLQKTLSGIKSKYGVDATYGNHDIQEPILAGFTFGGKDEKKQSDPRMDAFMQKAGLTLLQEKGVWIDDSVDP